MGIERSTLPLSITNSRVLNNDNIQQLITVDEYPTIDPLFDDHHLKQIIQYYSLNPDEMENEIHLYAKKLLEQGKVNEAWQVLLSC